MQELAKCCSMCKLGLSLEEVRTLHGFFDRGGDGYISFDEFIKAIRGSLSPTRRKLVTKVFNALDASGDQNGYLTIEDLQHAYSAGEHPDVKGGRRTEKEVLLDLLEVFEGSGSDSSKKGDGIVTLDEWIGYYEEVSSSIDTDDYFGAMITRCWSALKSRTADGRLVPAVSYVSAREINNVEAILRTSIYQKAKRGMSEARTVEDGPRAACNPRGTQPATRCTQPATGARWRRPSISYLAITLRWRRPSSSSTQTRAARSLSQSSARRWSASDYLSRRAARAAAAVCRPRSYRDSSTGAIPPPRSLILTVTLALNLTLALALALALTLTLAPTLALIPTPTLTRYDADASGQLTYTQFAHGLYAEESQAREQSAGGGVNPLRPSFSSPLRPSTAQGGHPLEPLQSSRPSSTYRRGRSMANPAGPPEPDAFKRSSGIFR